MTHEEIVYILIKSMLLGMFGVLIRLAWSRWRKNARLH